jgi:ribose transport system permease protein
MSDSQPTRSTSTTTRSAVGSPSEDVSAPSAQPRGVKRGVRLADVMTLVLLILLILAGSLLSDVFFTPNNLYNILWAVSVLGIVSLGQTLLLISCNFDMSVTMVVTLAGTVCVGLQIAGWGLWPSLLGGILAAMLVGLLNGMIVVITKAYPFLITYGMQILVYAVQLMLTGASTWYGTIPEFTILGRGKVFGVVHYSILIFLGLALILEFVLRRTPYGRYLFVLGLNEKAAHLGGVPVNRVKLVFYTFSGFTAGLTGLIMTSRLNQTRASGALGMDFDSVIAAVLGGTNLFGGEGSTLRTVIGVIVLGVLNNVMVLAGVPYDAQWIGKGIVFLLIVGIDMFFKYRKS